MEGRCFSYAVTKPRPGADTLARSKLTGSFARLRGSRSAPRQYGPSARVKLWAVRVIEEDEHAELPPGTIVWRVEYLDGLLIEVPEEYLEATDSIGHQERDINEG